MYYLIKLKSKGNKLTSKFKVKFLINEQTINKAKSSLLNTIERRRKKTTSNFKYIYIYIFRCSNQASSDILAKK